MTAGSRQHARHAVLLALLVVIWAIAWPVVKVGVEAMPPLWYGCLRFVIAASLLFAFVIVRGELVWPSRSDWRLVAVSGVLQLGTYSALSSLALTSLPPGRASVLAYSTPLWVVPLAAWRLHEHASRRALFGVGLGLSGVLVIVAPALQRGENGQVLPYVMLLGAAAVWAISIVFVRGHRFESSALALAPWQMLVAASLLGPLAMAVEGAPPAIRPKAMASLAYVGPIATAFAGWAIVEVARHLRARTVSMALLATPSLGLLISAAALGEKVTGSLVTGIVLVAAGIRFATGDAAAGAPGRARNALDRDLATLPFRR